ncbi:hypothetical protein Cfor_07299, partial [Coptotermes formosanus]
MSFRPQNNCGRISVQVWQLCNVFIDGLQACSSFARIRAIRPHLELSFNTKNKKGITYPNLPSAIRPVSHGLDMPVPNPSKKLRTLEAESSATPSESSEESEYGTCTHGTPEPFTQTELSDLFRDLNVPKDAAEILGSRLKGKKLLTPETYVTFYRNREKDLLQYFIQEESVVYCNDIPSVINMLVPVGHSVHLNEGYENIEQQPLEKINYKQLHWMVCGDTKVLCMLLGQKQGYIKSPCYICEWDSRAQLKHWLERQWTHRTRLIPGCKNILRKSLVGPEKIILPHLLIKFDLIKQFVKALDGNGNYFNYLSNKFPALSEAKIKEGISAGPQIRAL